MILKKYVKKNAFIVHINANLINQNSNVNIGFEFFLILIVKILLFINRFIINH